MTAEEQALSYALWNAEIALGRLDQARSAADTAEAQLAAAHAELDSALDEVEEKISHRGRGGYVRLQQQTQQGKSE